MAVGWSAYFVQFIEDSLGAKLDHRWVESPIIYDMDTKQFRSTGAYINLPAIVICVFITLLLIRGMSESTKLNNVIVAIKVTVVLLFIFTMAREVNTDLWKPFIPPNDGQYGHYGITGVLQGRSLYIARSSLLLKPLKVTTSNLSCQVLLRCFSAISDSMLSVLQPKNVSTPREICPGEQSFPWRSAPCCTSVYP